MKLNLKDYEFEAKGRKGYDKFTANTKAGLCEIMSVPGIYDNGIEMCDGIKIARKVKNAGSTLNVTESEIALIRKVFDKHIKLGSAFLGGPRYQELVMRVFNSKD